MKKTSRRTFGKELTGAIAALTVSAVASKADAKLRETQRPKPRAVEPKIFTHDTPPPVEVVDGSLLIESALDYGNPSQQGSRWLYKQNASPKVEHIKILHGSGDLIYRNLEAGGCVIRINWKDKNARTGFVSITGGSEFVIDSDRRMTPGNTGKKKRKYKWDHPGNGNDFRIESIVVTDASGATMFSVTAPQASADPEEYRIMIWHE